MASEGVTSRGWLVPVSALFVASFAVGTAELIVTGLLPTLAADLRVDIPTAGLLIAGYALGVAVGGPVLALLTRNLPRRLLLIAMMATFVVGNVLCAVSTAYWMLLLSRLVVACSHGLFFGAAMVTATSLAPPQRQATAVSIVISGITIATVLGVPVGTAIGNAVGWRASFWVIAALGAVAAAILAVLVPLSGEDTEATQSTLRAELRAVMRPTVLLCYGIITLFICGVLVVFAYIVPLLTITSGVPAGLIPWQLFAMGVAGFCGNLLGGRLGDWKPIPTMIGVLAVVIAIYVVLLGVVSSAAPAAVAFVLLWMIGFAFPAPVQTRILKEASDAPNLASTLISTAFNIGIAAGAALGGAVLAAGWSYGQLPLLSIGFMSAALAVTVVMAALGPRLALTARPA